jgi:acetyl esterase/lipase
VSGVSAGGNFAAVMSILARDQRLFPPLTGSYLSIPAIMAPDTVPEKYKSIWLSNEQNKNAPLLDITTFKSILGESITSNLR